MRAMTVQIERQVVVPDEVARRHELRTAKVGRDGKGHIDEAERRVGRPARSSIGTGSRLL